MSGINIIQKYHAPITEVATTWAGSDDATGKTINTNGYTKLMVHYVCSTGWDRVGSIICLGSLRETGTFVSPDDTVENSSFSVSATDDTTTTGAGQWYVVENIAPYTQIIWDNTTAGTTGTLTVLAMPFNE